MLTRTAALLLAILTVGCIATDGGRRPPEGILFTQVKGPLQVNFDSTPVGSRKGTASALYVYDPIVTGLSLAWGDASIAAAARNGRLKQVNHVDYGRLSILFVFTRLTVEAYGE